LFAALAVAEVLIVEQYDDDPNTVTVSQQGAAPESLASYVIFWQEKNGKVSLVP
jgi:fructoselysine-6-P-deglycase FrlB-like protein